MRRLVFTIAFALAGLSGAAAGSLPYREARIVDTATYRYPADTYFTDLLKQKCVPLGAQSVPYVFCDVAIDELRKSWDELYERVTEIQLNRQKETSTNIRAVQERSLQLFTEGDNVLDRMETLLENRKFAN